MSYPDLEQQVPRAAKLVAVDGRTFPFESARLLARAEGGIATSTLAQTFANPYDEPLEVLYTLPLPVDGAVLGYTIRIGEKLIRGEVQPREKAARAYKEALFAGKTAGLLEQNRADTFEQKLGNVPPRTKVEVTIDVLHPLVFLTAGGAVEDARLPRREFAAAGGSPRGAAPEWEYRFPTVVGVRYHGAPGRVPDQESLSPDRGAPGDIPTRVELTLTIADEAGGSAWSPSHAVRVGADRVVTFDDGERLDRDVIVRWVAAASEVGLKVVEGGGLAGDDGRYALVTVVPPAGPAAMFRRDVTVLIDASGSMEGEPLELAKRVVGDLLRSLTRGDRFELLAFANDVTRLNKSLTPFDEKSLRSAIEALGRLRAGGGTEMARGITEAMKPAGEDAQRQVVLVTDGQIGFEAEVVGRVAEAHNVRLHAVGVGHAPNRALTQQAAAVGRGLELLVTSEADAADAARRLVAGTASPVLAQVTAGGTALTGDRPSRLRDVFAGQPLKFTVELSRQGGTFELRGTLAGSRQAWFRQITVPAAGAAEALPATSIPLGALHGREVVAEMELARADSRRGGVSDLDRRIEAVAMRHRIVSRCTSLVAIAEEPSVDPRAPRRRERLEVEVPAGVSAEGSGLMEVGFTAMRATMMRPAALDALECEISDLSVLSQLTREGLRRRGVPAITKSSPARGRSDAFDKSQGGPPPFDEEAAAFRRREEALVREARVREWLSQVRHDFGALDVSWPERDILIVEFKVPYDGLTLPDHRVEVLFRGAGGREESASGFVMPDRDSHLGPHVAGTVVRLVIQLRRESGWSGQSGASIAWTSRAVGPEGAVHELPARLHVEIPQAPEREGERTPYGPHGPSA